MGLALTLFCALARSPSCTACGTWPPPPGRPTGRPAADLFGFLEERLGGLTDLRANGAQAHTLRRFYGLARARFRRSRAGRRSWGPARSPSPAGCSWLGYILAFALGAALFRRRRRSPSARSTSSSTTPRCCAAPCELITRAGAGLPAGRRRPRARREPCWRTRSTPRRTGPAAPRPSRAGRPPAVVPSSDVSFALRRGAPQPVLRGTSPSASPPGEALGLLGRTGSGKTTLTRLLFRLYDPAAPGRSASAASTCAPSRLAELRAPGRPGHPGGAALPGHRARQPDPLRPRHPRRAPAGGAGRPRPGRLAASPARRGWTPQLGRRRRPGLSAGEAQLLAFARVFLRDPGLVILDEASSRLDPATEQRLIERAVDRLLARAHGDRHRPPPEHGAARRRHPHPRGRAGRGVGPAGGALAADPGSRFARLLRAGAWRRCWREPGRGRRSWSLVTPAPAPQTAPRARSPCCGGWCGFARGCTSWTPPWPCPTTASPWSGADRAAPSSTP